MMDPKEDTSVAQAILNDKTLNGKVGRVSIVEGPSGYGAFRNPMTGEIGSLVGCTWRVQVTP
jgi:hypothetical protein